MTRRRQPSTQGMLDSLGSPDMCQNSSCGLVKELALCLVLAAACSPRARAQGTPHSNWPGPGQLFVGTCYQPVDRSAEQIDRDIAIMRGAGFNAGAIIAVPSLTKFTRPGNYLLQLSKIAKLSRKTSTISGSKWRPDCTRTKCTACSVDHLLR